MANTTKKTVELYDTPGVDVDFDPDAPTGKKDSFWNRQVRLCKDKPGQVPADYDPNTSGPAGPDDVRKGWKFYPGAQGKFNDGPKRFPGIERRVGVHNGEEGLFLRYNPLLAARIEKTAKTTDNAKSDDKAVDGEVKTESTTGDSEVKAKS